MIERERRCSASFRFHSTQNSDPPPQSSFDSEDAPPGLPREFQHQGMTVRYAVGYESADELLEELIQAVATPRQTTVVSSDHRVQRAATRRKARAVDSEVWYEEVQAASSRSTRQAPTTRQEPVQSLTADEVAHWVEAFSDFIVEQPAPQTIPVRRDDCHPSRKPISAGYGEDLLDDS